MAKDTIQTPIVPGLGIGSVPHTDSKAPETAPQAPFSTLAPDPEKISSPQEPTEQEKADILADTVQEFALSPDENPDNVEDSSKQSPKANTDQPSLDPRDAMPNGYGGQFVELGGGVRVPASN